MRPALRMLLTAGLLTFAHTLSGCADFDADKAMETVDVFGWTKKKPLPGQREEVFPGGNVPGVTQGVPPELVKGYQPPAEAAPDPAIVAAEKVAEEEKPPPKPKPKQTAKLTRPKPQKPAAAPQPTGGQAAWPSSPPPQQAQGGAWPSGQPQQQQQQQSAQQGGAPWPAPQQPQQQATTPWPGTH
jgi:hypothetical protein